MKSYLFSFVSFLVVVNSQQIDNQNVSAFDKFILMFNKTYVKGSEVYNHRLEIFTENLLVNQKLNSFRRSSLSAKYGITKFSDLTQEEFKAQYLSSITINQKSHHAVNKLTAVPHRVKIGRPPKVDWRRKGIVTPVKNQEQCGGCWAYASVEAVESMYAKKTGKLRELSVQEVMDCSRGFSNLSGCNGGDTCNALLWMKKFPLTDAELYPTTNKGGEFCKYNIKGRVLVKNYTCINYVNDEEELLMTLARTGPVSASVDASMWSNYMGGIIQYHCGEVSNNHAVEIVGYDTSGPIPFYIAKNSWGKDFGINGYVLIEAKKNMCGIAEHISSVQVSVL